MKLNINDQNLAINGGNKIRNKPWLDNFHFGENTQILTELLNRGANPNVQTSHGFTPLHFCNSKKEVELLLSVGANPELKNKWGTTARESADGLKAIQPFNIPSPFDDI